MTIVITFPVTYHYNIITITMTITIDVTMTSTSKITITINTTITITTTDYYRCRNPYHYNSHNVYMRKFFLKNNAAAFF